jgi:hypothetical protein
MMLLIPPMILFAYRFISCPFSLSVVVFLCPKRPGWLAGWQHSLSAAVAAVGQDILNVTESLFKSYRIEWGEEEEEEVGATRLTDRTCVPSFCSTSVHRVPKRQALNVQLNVIIYNTLIALRCTVNTQSVLSHDKMF